MTVDSRISLAIVQRELEDCRGDAQLWGWEISEVRQEEQLFTVKMTSPLDNEQYVVKIKFDNYREWPLLVEFVDPISGVEGTLKAYPLCRDGFFHKAPCICHPSSRKAYKQYSDKGPHEDWSLANWEVNPGVGSLRNLRATLQAIYARISNPAHYLGRME